MFNNFNSLESNIWKYTLFLAANKRIFAAILSAYYLTIPDSTVQSVGVIFFFGSMAGFIFEIPSGYFSDKMGHKQALILSRIFTMVSTMLLLVADALVPLIISAILFSISHCFMSGTGSAFMHETLRGLNKEDEYSKIMGKVTAIGFAIPIPLIILTPFLVSISFKAPFIIALIIDFIALIATISLVKPPVTQEYIEEVNATNFKQVMQEGYKLNFLPFALFTGILSGVLFSIGGFTAAYQSVLEIPVIYYGLFFGIGRILSSVLLAYNGRIKSYFTLYSFCRFKLIFYTVLISILGLFPNTWVVVTCFIVLGAFQWGLNQVDTGFALDIIKNSKFKATLLSVQSQIDLIVNSLVSLALGAVILRSTYQVGFIYLALAFVIILLPIYLYMQKANKFNF